MFIFGLTGRSFLSQGSRIASSEREAQLSLWPPEGAQTAAGVQGKVGKWAPEGGSRNTVTIRLLQPVSRVLLCNRCRSWLVHTACTRRSGLTARCRIRGLAGGCCLAPFPSHSWQRSRLAVWHRTQTKRETEIIQYSCFTDCSAALSGERKRTKTSQSASTTDL